MYNGDVSAFQLDLAFPRMEALTLVKKWYGLLSSLLRAKGFLHWGTIGHFFISLLLPATVSLQTV